MDTLKKTVKIKFKQSLGKILNILLCVIALRPVFQKISNYYPQVHLHEFLYEYEYKDEGDSYSIV